MTMAGHVKGYVAGKKALGLSFREEERMLMRYAEFADARGDRFVRADSVLDWAARQHRSAKPESDCTSSAAWPSSSMSGTTVTMCPTGRLSAGRDGTGRRRAFRRQRTSGRS